MRTILETHPEFLLGGHSPLDKSYLDMFGNFWEGFRHQHGDHEIYKEKSMEERRRTVPIMLHGDEGRGLAKVPLLVISFQVLIPFSGPNKLNCSKYPGFVINLENFGIGFL